MADDTAATPADDRDFDWEEALRFKGWPKFPEQNADGIDLSLIRENLKLSPEERLARMDRGRRSALELMRIGREHRERQRKSA